MVRVNLPGVATARKKLADGTIKTYRYAWRGGPILPGDPGTAAFIAAYHAFHSARPNRHTGTINGLLIDYQRSPYFSEKAAATKRDYLRHLRAIESEFGDMPIGALADRRVRGDFLDWRDRLAVASPRQADYALAVLALVLAWAADRGRAPANPLEKPAIRIRVWNREPA